MLYILTLFRATFFSNTNTQGGGIWPAQCILFLLLLKFEFFHICFIGLKWSLVIFRKSQTESALISDHKGANNGDMLFAGPYGPPPCVE